LYTARDINSLQYLRMKIALLTDGIFPYVVGGMQKHSYHLLRQLVKNNHTVYLFHCSESSYDATKLELFSEKEKKNIHSCLIPFPHKNYFPLHYIYESRDYSKTIYEKLKPLLKDIDFVFAQGFCAWELLKNKQTGYPPVAIHFHGFEMFQNIPSFKAKLSAYFLRNAVKENLSLSDYAISYGGAITSILKELVPAEKIWEIPAGIENSWLTDNISPVNGKVKFLFVGRYERRKGIQELNQAIKQLLPENNFTFDFIGNIPTEYQITSPLLCYHGKLSSEEEIKKIIRTGDVLICPSYAEGMPNVILEAMAMGLAIIATDVGAVSVMVNSENGWLLDGPDPQLITNAMQQAIKEAGGLTAKKEASVIRIKNSFLIDSVTAQLVTRMQQCIAKKK